MFMFNSSDPVKVAHLQKISQSINIEWATDSCRDEWNVRNGLNLVKILHSVGESVDCVLLLVLVLLLSKYNYVILFCTKSIASVCCRKYINLLMLSWKNGCMGCFNIHCQDILVVDQKNGCFSCFGCTPWH